MLSESLFLFLYLGCEWCNIFFSQIDLYVIRPMKVTSSNCLKMRTGDLRWNQNCALNVLRPLSYIKYIRREHCSDEKVYHLNLRIHNYLTFLLYVLPF